MTGEHVPETDEERFRRDKVDNCLEQGCVGPFGCAWFGLSCLGLLFVVPIWMK